MLFNEPNQRTFEFEWEFAPRNAQEAAALKSIISTFKIHGSPEKVDNGSIYQYPSEFEIIFHFMGDENIHIPKIARCALTNIQTSYTNSGVFAALKGGEPAHIRVALSFSELELLDRSHYLDNGF